jgi:hypothetical protein
MVTLPEEKPCAVCGVPHAPLDPGKRYSYATDPSSPLHGEELAWFAKHGIDVLHGIGPTEALAKALSGA